MISLVFIPAAFVLNIMVPERTDHRGHGQDGLVTASTEPLSLSSLPSLFGGGSPALETNSNGKTARDVAPIDIGAQCRRKFEAHADAVLLTGYCIEQEQLFQAKWTHVGRGENANGCAAQWPTWQLRVQCVERLTRNNG